MSRHVVRVLGCLVLTSACLAVSFCDSQAGSYLGITVGANSSGFQGSDTSARATGTYRFSGGMFLRQDLKEWLSVEPAVLYVQKGGGAAWVTDSGWRMGTQFYDLRLSYLEFPVLARVALPFQSDGGLRFHVLGGPYLAAKLDSKMESTWKGAEAIKAELRDVRSVDLGGILGLGVVVPTSSGAFGVDFRYTVGFLPIRDTADPPDVRNSGITLTASFANRLGRR